MKWRNTLILAVIALAGVAYFRFFEMKRPSTEEARRQAQNVVNFDRSKIDGIVIQNGDQKIEIRRRVGRQNVCALPELKGNVSRDAVGQERYRQKTGGISRQKTYRCDGCAGTPRHIEDARW